ncbi:MAG: hypothetical protein V8S72_01115 [Oscillospiraceae bacterium]
MSMAADAVTAGNVDRSRTEAARGDTPRTSALTMNRPRSLMRRYRRDIISLRGAGSVTRTGGTSRKGRVFVYAVSE